MGKYTRERPLALIDSIGETAASWDGESILFSSEPAAQGNFGLACLLLLWLPWRSNGPASVHATVNVLLFLLRWFQDLTKLPVSIDGPPCKWRQTP